MMLNNTLFLKDGNIVLKFKKCLRLFGGDFNDW